MDPESNAPLERSTSQISTTSTSASASVSASTSAKGPRATHSTRAKSKSRKLISQPSSSASSIAASSIATSDKSLTSFPSFSPQSPQYEPSFTTPESNVTTASADRKPSSVPTTASIVESLTSSETQKAAARNALFDDSPLATQKIPGALHHADDEHIQRLIGKHGAVNLVRQVAEDLAHRDHQIARLRRRADERERALRKIILGCGLSSLDLETKLRSVEAEFRTHEKIKCAQGGDVSSMMSDAMHDSMSYNALGINELGGGTLRASSLSMPKENITSKGTMKAWKDYLWGGGTSRKASRAGSINEEGAKTVIRMPTPGDRRPALQDDLFTPPDADSTRNSSRASSVHSGNAARKQSASFASMALQLVAGKASSIRDSDSVRGRSDSAGQGGSVRSSSNASSKAGGLPNRAVSAQGGPKALMSMRRATPKPMNLTQHSRPRDRREGVGANPESPSAVRSDNYGPVEMDTIFSPEGQPPALSQLYSNYNSSEYLIDRFGFIYDQRRKKRQREAAQVALQMKRGHEMLSGGRSSISPNLLDDGTSSIRDAGNDDRSESPISVEDVIDQSKPKRWQDYLKIATFPTELLSHTPSITATNIEVLEGNELPKSPSIINSENRGFVPSASTTSALDREASPKPEDEPPAATLVHEDAEPVKLLLKQLSDVHDALQREKSVRWNEFLRKVRAERRREGEAAAATAAAAAEARFQLAPVMIPEAKLNDGETIGIADLGVKGKVGRAKWNEFRSLVLGGIPVVNRPKIWAECSGALSRRTPGYYKDLASRSGEADDAAVISQIEMDINRTLTDNIFFRKGPGVVKLSEVLRAYARHNPEVGYCQGMNLIAANLLLIMPSAEDAFWVFVSIIERILPQGYYDHSLMASRADQQVLRLYVGQVLPKLSQHLEALSIELEALTFQWFLSVFTDCLSAEALFRVWDVVLCINDGSTFLFQVALALLKLNEQQLLQCDTPAAIYTYINHQMTNHAISIDGLIQASEGLRRVVRREDVEERRARAIEADRQLMRERELRNAQRRSQKGVSAPALVTEASASVAPSPAPRPVHEDSEIGSVASLSALDAKEEDEDEGEGEMGVVQVTVHMDVDVDIQVRTPIPVEEETSFGLG